MIDITHPELITYSPCDRHVTTGVDHGGMRGMHPPYDRSGGGGGGLYNHPPYKGDEPMKSILHNTQIITPEEIVSYIDDEIILSRKCE